MASLTFGSGRLFYKHPTTNQVYQVGVLDDVTLNFDSSTKEKYGSNQFPIATVVTSKKVSGKATFANIDGKLIATLMSGTTTSGRNIMGEFTSTGASTVVSPTGTGMNGDYGCIDAAGNPMTLTASLPAVGAYAYNSGTATYTFNASEPVGVKISYSYATGSGQTHTIENKPMGTQTNFEMFLQEVGMGGETFGVKLFSVVVPSLNFGFKNEDFGTQDLQFSAQTNNSGQIGAVYSE